MADPTRPFLVDPKTDSQLRAVLNRLRQNQVTFTADLSEVENVVVRQGTATAAVAAGHVLYAPSSGNVAPAQANTAARTRAIGVALNAASIGDNVVFVVCGAVSKSGLVAGTEYFLSAVSPGTIVSTPDASAGQYIASVGVALTNGVLIFLPKAPILL